MLRRKRKDKSFFHPSFLIGIAIVLVAVLLGIYFFSEDMTEHEKLTPGELVTQEKYYDGSPYENWHTIDVGPFTIQAPSSYYFYVSQGIDSYVGGVTNRDDSLFWDYGRYSSDLNDYEERDGFEVLVEDINGKNFKLVWESNGTGYAAAFTDELEEGNRLLIFCRRCKDPEEKLRMFRTIEFE